MVKELPLLHHVYSSLGGYKTLYSSSQIPKEVVDRLDRYSTETYDKIPSACPREVFFLEDGYICLSRKFENGSDHVGRRRTCVHNVLIRTQDTLGIPFFNPYFLPDSIFIPPEANLQQVSRYLQRSYLVEQGEFVDLINRLRTQKPHASLMHDLLLAMLSGRSTCILRGPAKSVVEMLEKLTLFLPPVLRSHFGLIAFYPIKHYIVMLKNRFSVIVLSRNEPIDSFIKDRFIVIDFVEKAHHNLPSENALADFIVSALFDEGRMGELVKLLKVLENYRTETVPTPDLYKQFFKAYDASVDFFTPAGAINVASNPGDVLDCVIPFYKAGYWNIALDIIEKCFRLLINRQYFRSFDAKKAEQLELFVTFLLEAFEKPAKRKSSMTFSGAEAKSAVELLENIKASEDVVDFDI